MAQLLMSGVGRDEVMAELGISKGTFYRLRASEHYKRIGPSLGVAPAPDHPDMVAARNVAARTELSIAQKVERGVDVGLDVILEMMLDPGAHRLGEVVAATKFLMEQHAVRAGVGVDDAEPLTAADVAAVRKMTGAA
jgi:hypothetical protein